MTKISSLFSSWAATDWLNQIFGDRWQSIANTNGAIALELLPLLLNDRWHSASVKQNS
jgi:hypothetical protein